MNMPESKSEDVFWGRCDPAAVTRGPFKFPAPHWRDDNTCSHCGGMRPSIALKAICEGVAVEPTDKNYKIYLRGFKVPGGGCPASKCYLNHFSESQAVEFVLLVHTGKMKIDYPGHFYSGMCFGRYKEAIQKAIAEANGVHEPIVGGDRSHELPQFPADGGGTHPVDPNEITDGPNIE